MDAAMQTLINTITVSRMLLALTVFFAQSESYLLGISIWAAASDFLDGQLARRLQLTSTLGERLDQIADKIFHFCMLILLLRLNMSDLYFIVLFVLREALIIIFRQYGLSTASSVILGKWKTVFTYAYIIYAFTLWYVYHSNPFFVINGVFQVVILLLSYLSLALSVKRRYSEKVK